MAGQPQVRVLLVDAHEEARLSLVRLIQDDTRVIVSAHFGSVPEAAKMLGISRATAYRKIAEYEIER